MGDHILGKTRWRRFGIVYGAVMGAMAAGLLLVASGFAAVPLVISGLPFTLTGTELHGQNFQQWGDVDACGGVSPSNPLAAFCFPGTNGTANFDAVGVTSIGTLDGSNGHGLAGNGILNLSQTVCGPTGLSAPWAYLKMALTGDSVTAHNLIADVTDLTTNAGATTTFTNLVAGTPLQSREGPMTFGQTADNFDITGASPTNFTQTAVYTSAGTFAVKNLALHVSFANGCS